ncbi:MAG: DUF4271 domain-containing protein [Flavobacteriia bacterium]|nr:DUF4271 domain-containing protein [Flavobacteriia bacterium]
MLNFIHQIVGNHSDLVIPSHLLEREINVTNLLIPTIIISFSLITLSKYRNSRVVLILSKLILSSKNLEHTIKEELRINSVSSIALIINYIVVLNICLLLSFLHYFHLSFHLSLLISVSVTLVLIILQIVGLWMIGFISNETKTLTVPIIETVIIYETFGFLLFFTALCWLLNPELSDLFLKIFISILSITFLIRFFKCSLAVLKRGVSWYYIILYLCTLEILPLFITYIYVQENFNY